LVADGFYSVAFLVLATSVISAFYYVRLVKIIFFEKATGFVITATPAASGQAIFIALTAINLCFILFLDTLVVHACDLTLGLIFNC